MYPYHHLANSLWINTNYLARKYCSQRIKSTEVKYAIYYNLYKVY